MLTEKTVNQFLDELSSDSPAPGGGSVAALAGSLGAALTSMVCRLTVGKKKYVEVQDEIAEVLDQSEVLRKQLSELVEEDTKAFNEVMKAFGMPKENEEQQQARSAAIQEATKYAMIAPLNVMKLSLDAMHLARTVAEKGNKNSISDAGVAALMLQAACSSAALNVRINLQSLKDESFVHDALLQMKAFASSVDQLGSETLSRVDQSLG